MRIMDKIKVSKFLSLVLRHRPEASGVVLDENGWVGVDALLKGMSKCGMGVTIDELEDIVATNDKKRFEFNEDGTKIRACQGHSLSNIDLGLVPKRPPEFLYHGTATIFLDSILKNGLHPRSRQYVHLSLDVDTATKVGSRHGKPVVLRVAAATMNWDGHQFFLSSNNVWLTKIVPPRYLSFE